MTALVGNLTLVLQASDDITSNSGKHSQTALIVYQLLLQLMKRSSVVMEVSREMLSKCDSENSDTLSPILLMPCGMCTEDSLKPGIGEGT